MQNYAEIGGQTTVKNSRAAINDNFETIQSHNSGTTFPTTNLFAGMKCYRTDTGHTYTLTDVDKQTWVDDAAADTSKTCSGNASTASKLAVPISVSIQDAGGVNTGAEVSFDGSGNLIIKLPSTIAAVLNGSVTGNAATATVATQWSGTQGYINDLGTENNSDTWIPVVNGAKLQHTAKGNMSVGHADTASSCTGNSATASAVRSDPAAGSGADLVYSQMADNDFFRIRTSGGSNAGEVELATADDGNEPIYVRQYSGVFASLARTAALLDGNGNTSFPGTVTAPTFSGSLSGTASNSDTVDGWHLQSILDRISASNTGGIVAQSLGTNGYAKWSTGLILQWGYYSCSSSGATFPISFSSACYGVLATRVHADHGDVIQPNVESWTTSTAYIKLGAPGAGHEFYSDHYVFILAIGR